MGIAIHSLSSSASLSLFRFGTPRLSMMLAPVQALVAFFTPMQPAQASHRPATRSPAQRMSHAQNIDKRTPPLAFTATGTRHVSRLKVMRQFEPGMARSQAGRMAISGRMADVCAELDRIAQRETLGS
ncbi:MAG: hypothetical protein H7197_09400 [Vitreoscilla sp.]|nr:hypothetical protein [Polaromonas sp.]